jgi:hypothetical protein
MMSPRMVVALIVTLSVVGVLGALVRRRSRQSAPLTR